MESEEQPGGISVDVVGARSLPRALILFLQVLASISGLSLLNAAFSFARHHGWQASEPLAPPRPGVDFYIYLERMQFLHRPEFFTQHFSLGWYYPAPAIFGYAFFYEFCVGDRWKIGYSVMVAAGVWSAFLHCRPLWEFLRRISRRCAELLTLGSDSDCGAAEKDA